MKNTEVMVKAQGAVTNDNPAGDAEEYGGSVIRRKEWLVEKAKKFNLLSNIFLSVALDDKEACQHVIRVLTGIPDLVVKEVHIFYISETDLWKAGRTVYKVEKKFQGTGVPYDDGIHVIYVNAEIDDGSDTARLMDYFRTADPQDMRYGALSKRVHLLKCEEGGYGLMDEISEEIYNVGKEDGVKEGIKEGEQKQAMITARRMKNKGYSDTAIADLLEVGVHVVEQWIYGENKVKS